MSKLCIHKWKRSNKLVHHYFDYSGFHVGVFECKCEKCGIKANKKFLLPQGILCRADMRGGSQ